MWSVQVLSRCLMVVEWYFVSPNPVLFDKGNKSDKDNICKGNVRGEFSNENVV